MRFLSIYTPADGASAGAPTAARLEEMGALVEEGFKSGALVTTGGLLPLSEGAVVERTGDQYVLVDVPIAEAQEASTGYAILNADSKEAVIEMVKDFLRVAGPGKSEIFTIMGGPPETGD